MPKRFFYAVLLYAVVFYVGAFLLAACTPPNTPPELLLPQTDTLFFAHNTLALPEERTLAFTIRDQEDAPEKLLLSAVTSDQVLVPLTTPSCDTTGVCTLTLQVAKTTPGTALVTLTLQDTKGARASSTFTLTVAPEEKSVASGAALKGLLESAPAGTSLKLTNSAPILLDTQIILDKELTLQGLGLEQTLLDAQSLNRLFWIKPTANITLQGMTLTNGNAKDDGGTIEDDVVGGAIFNEGRLALDKVRIINSRAVKGGGIYTFTTGETILTDSIIGQENASNIASRSGGGIFNDGGKVAVIKSQIAFNIGQERGGGIHDLKATALTTVTDSRVSNNLSLDGAAIKNEEGQLIIRGSTLENNRATQVEGGAIFNSDRLEIYSSVLRNNVAEQGAGGAIYTFRPNSTVLLDGVTLENNQAKLSGGGLASDTDMNGLSGSVIIQNGSKIIGNTTSDRGGGVFNAGNLSITPDCQISGNAASNGGGGLFIFSLDNLVNTDPSILDSVVSNNQPDNIATPPAGLRYVARLGKFIRLSKFILINKSH